MQLGYHGVTWQVCIIETLDEVTTLNVVEQYIGNEQSIRNGNYELLKPQNLCWMILSRLHWVPFRKKNMYW